MLSYVYVQTYAFLRVDINSGLTLVGRNDALFKKKQRKTVNTYIIMNQTISDHKFTSCDYAITYRNCYLLHVRLLWDINKHTY